MSRQTKTNNGALKAFALTLAILILAVCVTAAMTQGFTDWNPYGWFDAPAADEQTPESDDPAPEEPTEEPPAVLDANITNSPHIKIAMSPATSSAEDGSEPYTKSVTLTATVMPIDAPDKTVDWSVEWNEAPTYGADPVTDYVTVAPQSDGSNIATVTCLKPFGNDTIIVRVTTRVGGFVAEAEVFYSGTPTNLSIDTASLDFNEDAGWGLSFADVWCGNSYSLDLVLNNEFGQVNENFEPNFNLEVTGVGSFNYTLTKKIGLNGSPQTEQRVCNFTDEPVDASILQNLISVSIDTDLSRLTITPNMSVASYFVHERADGGRSWYEYQFASFADPGKVPYIQIEVNEANTGLSTTLRVQIKSEVSSVSLDQSSIVF